MELISTTANPAPPGAVPAMIRAVDGIGLRTVRWHPAGRPRGTIVLAGGRAEFVEKYFETIGELLARDLVVVAFDWRGQGMSDRELDDRRKGHIDDFGLYQRDIDAVLEQVLEPFCPKPWFGLAHSMGASILLTQARNGRSPFERLVLTAPMIGLKGLSFAPVLRGLAATLDLLGLGGLFIPNVRRRAYPTLGPFESNRLTSDLDRFLRLNAVIAADPHLFVGDPTIGWVNAAFRLMRNFQDPEFPRRTMVPMLVFAASDDRLVDSRAIERFATRLKAGKLIVIDRARHEILMEKDHLRQQFWAAFDAFIPGERDEYTALLVAQTLRKQEQQRSIWSKVRGLFAPT